MNSITVGIDDGLILYVLQDRDGRHAAAAAMEQEIAQLRAGLAEVETKLQQMGQALVELARAGQDMSAQGPPARQADQTALRDWVAEELTKLRGQGKVRGLAAPSSTPYSQHALPLTANAHRA